MEVLAFDVKENEELASRLSFRYAAMNDLLARSDIVTLHVPGNDKTNALVKAISTGKMRAAGLQRRRLLAPYRRQATL